MATTLPAPPEKVWPWLVQMGGDRAGWYGWDWLDNGGRPSADRIVAQWQNLAEGQRVDSLPKGHNWRQNWMTVAVLEPNRTLVLRSNYALPSFRTFDPRSATPPPAYLDAVWGFHLRPAPGGKTRLVVRTRGCGPRAFTRPFDLLNEPRHFVMQTRQFHNLRTRVDGSPHPPDRCQ
jgi:proline iminopeptidase